LDASRRGQYRRRSPAGGREAPVTGAKVEDVCGGLLPYDQTLVPLESEAGEVVVEKGVEGSCLQREAGNQHVVRSSGGSRDR
jgi:hypothetical protein